MNHAITVGGLLLGCGFVIGTAVAGVGALAMLAGGMSDAPQEGASANGTGCTMMAGGALLFAICLTLALI